MTLRGSLGRQIAAMRERRKTGKQKTDISKEIYMRAYREKYAKLRLEQIRKHAREKALADIRKHERSGAKTTRSMASVIGSFTGENEQQKRPRTKVPKRGKRRGRQQRRQQQPRYDPLAWMR